MKQLYEDNRIVLTLDAGGTNFVFSAIQACRQIIEPISLPANAQNLNLCLNTLETGFGEIKSKLKNEPVAISFAFPGPADYPNGIIGDLPNLPAFRGGIPLGPFLEEKFNIPVYINNDGDLFAYGEAMFGSLLYINNKLEEAGLLKRYRNLVGVTLGTGFGGGTVINGNLLTGDNAAGSEIWLMRNKKYRDCFVEESISIRAVKRVYTELTGIHSDSLTAKEIFEIAEGIKPGNSEAAIKSFEELGEVLGDTIANIITIIDGLIVIGGGLAGASKYFIPKAIEELNGSIFRTNGDRVNRLESKVFNLDDEIELKNFLSGNFNKVNVPGTNKSVFYETQKRTGMLVSKLGTNLAVSLGAYAFALNSIDKIN